MNLMTEKQGKFEEKTFRYETQQRFAEKVYEKNVSK